MEMLNQVELRGVVDRVKVTQLGPFKNVRLFVRTEYACKNKQGNFVIETTWHSVTVFAGSPDTFGVEGLVPGDYVFVKGRLRNNRFVAPDGSERMQTEVFANVVKKES